MEYKETYSKRELDKRFGEKLDYDGLEFISISLLEKHIGEKDLLISVAEQIVKAMPQVKIHNINSREIIIVLDMDYGTGAGYSFRSLRSEVCSISNAFNITKNVIFKKRNGYEVHLVDAWIHGI